VIFFILITVLLHNMHCVFGSREVLFIVNFILNKVPHFTTDNLQQMVFV